MQQFVQFSNDYDGVVKQDDGTYVAKCILACDEFSLHRNFWLNVKTRQGFSLPVPQAPTEGKNGIMRVSRHGGWYVSC